MKLALGLKVEVLGDHLLGGRLLGCLVKVNRFVLESSRELLTFLRCCWGGHQLSLALVDRPRAINQARALRALHLPEIELLRLYNLRLFWLW